MEAILRRVAASERFANSPEIEAFLEAVWLKQHASSPSPEDLKCDVKELIWAEIRARDATTSAQYRATCGQAELRYKRSAVKAGVADHKEVADCEHRLAEARAHLDATTRIWQERVADTSAFIGAHRQHMDSRTALACSEYERRSQGQPDPQVYADTLALLA